MEIFGDADFWGKLAKDPDTQWGRIPRVLGAYANRNNNLEKNERLRKKDRDYIKQKRRESTWPTRPCSCGSASSAYHNAS